MDFFLKNLLFGRQQASGGEATAAGGGVPMMMVGMDEDNDRKRKASASDASSGTRTPTLLSGSERSVDGSARRTVLWSSGQEEEQEQEERRPVKRFRGEWRVVNVAETPSLASEPETSSPAATATETPTSSDSKQEQEEESPADISCLPEDVLSHCLGFLGSVEDRHALQCTSKQFRRLSNEPKMLEKIQVGGDRETGKHGLLQEDDTVDTACERLLPFSQAGNLEAMYMLGIIKSYCHKDVKGGIALLKHAAKEGYVRASFALGLVLRDSHSDEAGHFMKEAANAGYIPALQEVLSAREMKAQHGELGADTLRLYLDPVCLNRLLSRFYCKQAELRDLSTSHCWNPLCGRWAFKANRANSRHHRHQPRFSFRNDSSVSNASEDASSLSSDSSHGTSTNAPSSNGVCPHLDVRVSRMKMCSRCCRAKYCSKLCQVYDWRSGRHKMECQFL